MSENASKAVLMSNLGTASPCHLKDFGMMGNASSNNQSKQLICGQSDKPEHEMRQDLCRAAHSNEAAAIIILQIGIDALCRASLYQTF